jgi:phage terminase small subunit
MRGDSSGESGGIIMARGNKKSSGRTTAKKVQANEDKPFVPTIAIKPEVDEGEWDADGLTVRNRSFVDALVGPAGGNASKAAEMAGYNCENRNSLRATASEILTKPNVARAIALALAKRRLTPEWAKNRLADIAGADMNNFMVTATDDDGNAYPKIDFERAAALGALGQIREYDPEKGKIRLHDPTPALVTILKLFGLITDKHEHNQSGAIQLQFDLSKLNDDELRFLREIRLRATPVPSGN